MSNTNSITERLVYRARRDLEREVEVAFRELDGWIRTLPSDYSTTVAHGMTYSDMRGVIIKVIVEARLPARADRDILEFMKKVEEKK